jgi:hypothetical protein
LIVLLVSLVLACSLPCVNVPCRAVLKCALGHLLPGGDQFPAGALGERLYPDREEQVVGDAELLAGVDASALAAQPLPVQQMRPNELRTQPRTAKPIDCFVIQLFGGRAVAQQRPAARLDAERDVRAAGLGRLGQPLERLACELGVASARGRLDELGQRQYGYKDLAGARRSLSGRGRELLITG